MVITYGVNFLSNLWAGTSVYVHSNNKHPVIFRRGIEIKMYIKFRFNVIEPLWIYIWKTTGCEHFMLEINSCNSVEI